MNKPYSADALSHRKVLIVSRCAWTLFSFRLSLIKAIAASGAEVIALGSGGDGFDSRLRAEGITFREIPLARRGLNPLADLRLLISLIAIIRRERPHVIHCFTVKPAIYGTIASRLCGVPARVVTITGLGHAFTSAGRVLNWAVSSLYRFALAMAHDVYFQNSEDRDPFVSRKLVHPDKAEVIAGTGIDVTAFKPVDLPVVRHAGLPRFLMIARLIKEKGIAEYVEAAAFIKQQYPSVEFELLGGPDERNPSKLTAPELQQLRNSRIVKWLGATDDVRPFIAGADVVVLPTYYREGLPRSLVEAGAMGRPAIATDTAGCRDAVVHQVTGLLVPTKNPHALAHAMRRYVENRTEIQSMGAAARAHVLANFDERKLLQRTLKGYQRLLQAVP